ncbi:MAG: hypothetical protein RL698_2174 [Pseudomonadota bacterium]
MRVVTRTFLLALVALALVPSGARAQTTVTKAEQSCLKERLIAIGKAAQCQSAAEGKYIASNLKEEDTRTRAASIEKCQGKLIEGYMTGARRSGYSACDSSEALAKAIAALDTTTQNLVIATDTTYPACSPRTAVSSCSGISGVTSTTCGNYFINSNGGAVTTSCQICNKYDECTACAAGTSGCYCSTSGPIICKWNGSSCTDGGGFCTN